MAEACPIDFINLNPGIPGLKVARDIKGYFTAGGGSRYILFKFPKIP